MFHFIRIGTNNGEVESEHQILIMRFCGMLSDIQFTEKFFEAYPSALPQSLVEKLAATNEGASVKEAYVKETEGKKIYKLVLVTTDEQELTVILDENGEPVKE